MQFEYDLQLANDPGWFHLVSGKKLLRSVLIVSGSGPEFEVVPTRIGRSECGSGSQLLLNEIPFFPSERKTPLTICIDLCEIHVFVYFYTCRGIMHGFYVPALPKESINGDFAGVGNMIYLVIK